VEEPLGMVTTVTEKVLRACAAMGIEGADGDVVRRVLGGGRPGDFYA